MLRPEKEKNKADMEDADEGLNRQGMSSVIKNDSRTREGEDCKTCGLMVVAHSVAIAGTWSAVYLHKLTFQAITPRRHAVD